MQPAAVKTPTKAQKILRRTLSGARLVAGLAAILWLTSRSNDGEPVFFAAAAVLVLAVWELARMGRCRSRGSTRCWCSRRVTLRSAG